MFVLEHAEGPERTLVLCMTSLDVVHLQESLTLSLFSKEEYRAKNLVVIYGKDKKEVLELLDTAGFRIPLEWRNQFLRDK